MNMTKMSKEQFLARQKAYGEGAQAAANRQPATQNPYRMGSVPPGSATELAEQWYEGWYDQRIL